MPDWTSLRLTWEPRILSILRIMTGLLFLQHGLNKFFNFPPAANPAPYDLFTLAPGLAGSWRWVGGILLVFGLFTRPAAFILSGEMAFAYFHGACAARLLSLQQRRVAGRTLLFRLSLFVVCGWRRVEPRPAAAPRTLLRPYG